ncbi:MAG: hypothetical protein AAGC81_19675 [Pseudomonadota bacterium]
MLYEVTKAAHLVSLVVWLGGMVAVAVALCYPAEGFLKPLKGAVRRNEIEAGKGLS